METFTHSNVKIGGEPDGHRLLTSKAPFLVNGVAATRLAQNIYAFRVLEGQHIADITELPEQAD